MQKVAKHFSHYLPFRSAGIVGGEKNAIQTEKLEGLVDMLVATPGRLTKHKEKSLVKRISSRLISYRESILWGCTICCYR